jgi:hypothetical protein
MPPKTAALLSTRMPFAETPSFAVMLPLLITAPPTEALLMVMPVRVGAVVPVAVMTPVLGGPVLVTLPVTVMPLMLMQLMAAELLTEL